VGIDDGVIQMNLGPGGAPPTDPPNRYPQVTGGSKDIAATVNTPVTLSAQATDDGIPRPQSRGPTRRRLRRRRAADQVATLRGAGSVTFSPEQSVPVLERRSRVDAGGVLRTRCHVVRAVAFDGLLETPHDIVVTVK
jgi:hypothetical protein